MYVNHHFLDIFKIRISQDGVEIQNQNWCISMNHDYREIKDGDGNKMECDAGVKEERKIGEIA
jgi:hypothetical protein